MLLPFKGTQINNILKSKTKEWQMPLSLQIKLILENVAYLIREVDF